MDENPYQAPAKMQVDDSRQTPPLRDRVIEFASNQLCVNKSRLTDETTLFGDLGVAGDDGVELFEEFEKRFHVDLSEFDPAAHFGPEAGAGPLRLLLLGRGGLRPRAGEQEKQERTVEQANTSSGPALCQPFDCRFNSKIPGRKLPTRTQTGRSPGRKTCGDSFAPSCAVYLSSGPISRHPDDPDANSGAFVRGGGTDQGLDQAAAEFLSPTLNDRGLPTGPPLRYNRGFDRTRYRAPTSGEKPTPASCSNRSKRT